MISSHLFLLAVLSCIPAAASVAVDRSFLQPSPDPSDLDEDVVYQHMHRLYEKYNRGDLLKEGNTVRSFKASQDSTDHRTVYRLNLTTLQDSEVILSATFHFLLDKHTHPKLWFCKRFKTPSCRSTAMHPSPSISLLLRSVSSGAEVRSGSEGSLLGNVTFYPHRRGVWQMKDVTQVIKEARDRGQLLVSVEMDLGQQHHKHAEEILSADSMPYLLLYADDQALTEPNSVAASLQRYDPFNEGAQLLHRPNSSAKLKGRVRREANLLSDPIQNNELPEVEYKPSGYRKDDLWESRWYLALKPKFKSEMKEKKRKSVEEVKAVTQPQVLNEAERTPRLIENDALTAKNPKDSHALFVSERRKNEQRSEGKKHKESTNTQSPILSFDEQTMRKARRRQWGNSHDRRCSRRNLRVDFADIGWSEWIIAPKAFDAYYCAGTCGFPMPQVVRPSNHATIQSIVRAVGIIPGIPEPCCVPENMSPLAVLFQDESRNPVLKVYPNMSVQSCSCR
ncbi:growth/differentiation factor 10 [Kryptolebias marmoratus]|uniref:Growth/differentiation factor 10 n=1 Tax=Kryptolebias marmoratus TaxID=37003 RepID=A0A3Q3BP07_KRYMA|nr:growth/differentiation factor 10 [Kryptolebias marmoratus]XP_017268228.1 growth/differentiation factor 10 [Kryptolebias marmoratus]